MLCNVKNKLETIRNSLKGFDENIDDKIDNVSIPLVGLFSSVGKTINKIKDKTKKIMITKAKVQAISSANVAKHKTNKKESDAHDIQDAKKDIKWDPMQHLKVRYTNIQYMNPASYSNSQDYPLKRGYIDEKKNFEVQNLVTGEWWRVHHTGYYQKVDGKGAYEEKIPGTAFYYIFGDVQKSVEGNVDKVHKQNYYTYTMQEKTEDIDGNHFLNNNSNWIINTLVSHTETVGVMKSVIVGGNILEKAGTNITIKAGGNITIEAGGVITLKGAKINLN